MAFMSQHVLYLLRFKSEPLIKIGITRDVFSRWRYFGFERFDFPSSYLVRASKRQIITALERNLKVFFSEYQVKSTLQLSAGNTETFDASILPSMLQFVEMLLKYFSLTDIRIEHGIVFPADLNGKKPKVRNVLWDHIEKIKELKGKGLKYREIQMELAKEGIKTSKEAVCSFYLKNIYYQRYTIQPLKAPQKETEENSPNPVWSCDSFDSKSPFPLLAMPLNLR